MACDYHSIDNESIQNELDANIRLLSEGWNGYIPFHCFVIEEDLVVHTIPTELILSKFDICEYVNGKCRQISPVGTKIGNISTCRRHVADMLPTCRRHYQPRCKVH